MKHSGLSRVKYGLMLLALASGLLAACQSSGSSVAETVVPRTVPPVTLLPATATGPAGSTAAPATTAGATSASTGVSTTAGTSASPSTTTTAGATASLTTSASLTSTSASLTSTNALLIPADTLIGLPVVDNANHAAGAVGDVLVDMTGTIQSVIVNLAPPVSTVTPPASATQRLSGTASITSTASLTGTASSASDTTTPGTNVGGSAFVAAAWAQFLPDAPNNRLVFQGTLSDLTHLPVFDENAICSGYIVPPAASPNGATTATGVLWRLGGALPAVNLQDQQGQPLGTLQTVLLDLEGGRAVEAIVQASAGLTSTPAVAVTTTPGPVSTSSGTGAGGAAPAGNCGPTGTGRLDTPSPNTPAATTPPAKKGPPPSAVPWARLKVDTSDPTSGTPAVRAQLTAAALAGAPAFDRSRWTLWPATAAPGWSEAVDQFWANH